ncbi:MAG: hypothetical protein NZ523_09350, partial [Elioraea sp.]|nr:hypothetical protein [Elioraea sp.]
MLPLAFQVGRGARMRLFSNLPIAGKLALSGAITLGLVAFLVLQTVRGLDRIEQANQRESAAAADESVVREAIAAVLTMPTFNRDAQMAQDARGAESAVARAAGAAEEAMARLDRLERRETADELRRRLAEAKGAISAYRDAIATMGEIRKRLLAARDEAFLPATAQFRDRVSQVETAIWLEGMDTVAENDARAKLVELGEAAADLRVAVLRYLATGEA